MKSFLTLHNNKGKAICRGREAEESPDRGGHPAVESTGGSNLTDAITENNRLSCASMHG